MIAMSETTVPNDIQAEVCVLGAMLLEPAAVAKARAIVTDADFYRPAHATLFRGICWCSDHADRVGKLDLVLLNEQLRRRGQLDDVGGIEYLYGLVNGVPDTSNVEYYANSVREKSRLRQVMLAGQELTDAASSAVDSDELLAAAGQKMAEVLRPFDRRNVNPASEVHSHIRAAIDGKRVSLDWPWRLLTQYARPCAPGCVTVICGTANAGKSFLFQEACLAWHEQGVPSAVMHLEKNRAYHLMRALAQRDGNGNLTHDEWHRQNPEWSMDAYARHEAFLDSYGKTIYDSRGSMTLDAVMAWIRARAGDGCRVIGVDPITAADAGSARWTADANFVLACEELAAKCGCSIVLVTHPAKGSGQSAPSLDNLAGGTAYARLTDCVLWLDGHNPPADNEIYCEYGTTPMRHNRTLSLCKTRDGTGKGMEIALSFDPMTLRTQEHGMIHKPVKKARHG